MAKTYRQKIGQWGENLAATWLMSQGYQCIQRNYFCAHGELDLIMQKDGVFIFVEVKTRRNDQYGLAEYSITSRKIKALMRSIDHYLFEHQLNDVEWQLDLVVVEKFAGQKEPQYLHFEGLGMYDD